MLYFLYVVCFRKALFKGKETLSSENDPSCDSMNSGTTLNEGTRDENQYYRQQVQGDFNSTRTNNFKLESSSGTARDSRENNKVSDHISKPPLQPSPNIVDQVAFSRTQSTCR